MGKDKNGVTGFSLQDVSHSAPRISDDVAELPDKDLEGYLIQSGHPEEKRKYRANPDFVLREIADEALLVPTGASAQSLNGMITFTCTGAFLWKKLMESPKTLEDLSEVLANEYGIAIKNAERDVTEYIKKAMENDMVLSISDNSF